MLHCKRVRTQTQVLSDPLSSFCLHLYIFILLHDYHFTVPSYPFFNPGILCVYIFTSFILGGFMCTMN